MRFVRTYITINEMIFSKLWGGYINICNAVLINYLILI